MKQFCCGEVVPGCAATFKARTEEDLLKLISAHALEDHGLTEIPPALLSTVRASIYEADAVV